MERVGVRGKVVAKPPSAFPPCPSARVCEATIFLNCHGRSPAQFATIALGGKGIRISIFVPVREVDLTLRTPPT